MQYRIQRKRIKGWKKPPYVIYVGRGSKYGNPFKIGEHINDDLARIVDPEILKKGLIVKDAAHAKELYRIWIGHNFRQAHKNYELISKSELISDLEGKNLMCWCKVYDSNGNYVDCHADVLLELANQ